MGGLRSVLLVGLAAIGCSSNASPNGPTPRSAGAGDVGAEGGTGATLTWPSGASGTGANDTGALAGFASVEPADAGTAPAFDAGAEAEPPSGGAQGGEGAPAAGSGAGGSGGSSGGTGGSGGSGGTGGSAATAGSASPARPTIRGGGCDVGEESPTYRVTQHANADGTIRRRTARFQVAGSLAGGLLENATLYKCDKQSITVSMQPLLCPDRSVLCTADDCLSFEDVPMRVVDGWAELDCSFEQYPTNSNPISGHVFHTVQLVIPPL